MADVTLTSALRANLLSLQGTQKQLDATQIRLATGKKVNSALDNANSFFAALSLTNRAGDLSKRLDGMGQAIQTLKSADQGITLITKFLEQLQATGNEALDQANAAGGAPADETSLEATVTELLAQIDSAVDDAGYRGTNLLSDTNATTVQLVVNFNEDATSSMTVAGINLHSSGAGSLAITQTTLDTAAHIQTFLDQIQTALDTVRAGARSFSNNLNIIQARQDFTADLINTLKEGSDKLTLADQNEEGANLLALQTKQQLGITSLSLASQAQQSVLRLFQ